MRTRIKFCGITGAADIETAASLAVDAIGLVFYPPSSRALSIEQAQELSAVVPPFMTRVALFLDPLAAEVDAVIAAIQPDLLQFHGAESAEFCRSFGRPYIKALALGGDPVDELDQSLRQQLNAHSTAQGFLADSHAPGTAGGTGAAFDWGRIPSDIKRRVILAGGLRPDNVAAAIKAVRPYAVDVSSGVESAPGIKGADKMREFVEQVRQADES